MSLYGCISCNLENVTFLEGGVSVHNAIGITIMKNLSIVVYHPTLVLVYGVWISYFNDDGDSDVDSGAILKTLLK